MKSPLPTNTKISPLRAVDAHAHAPWWAGHVVAVGIAMHGVILSQLMNLAQFWVYVLTVLSFGAGLCVWLVFKLGRPGYLLQSLLAILSLGGVGQLLVQYALQQSQAGGTFFTNDIMVRSILGLLVGSIGALALVRHGCAEDCPLEKAPNADRYHRLRLLSAVVLGGLFGWALCRTLPLLLPAKPELVPLYQYLLTQLCLALLVARRTHLWLHRVVQWNS